MKPPTDPLPEPWEWFNYVEEAWAAHNPTTQKYLAWTFNPVSGKSKTKMEGYEDFAPTDWVVCSYTKLEGPEAVFKEREQATHYIAMRAMLGTWAEKEE